MRKVASVLVFAAVAVIGATISQAQDRSDIAASRAATEADRQAIVGRNLPMTDEQAKAFWPAYRDYRGEMEKLGDRIVNLMLDFSKSYEKLTNEQATSMLNDYLSIETDGAKLRTEWVPKFGKILPPKSVVRLFQIENKLDAILRYQAADEIPLVEVEGK